MQDNNVLKGHLVALITVIIWGTTFISTKVLLVSFSPVEILFYRFMAGYFALLAVCPRLLRSKGVYEELYFMAAGISGVTLYFLLENIALTYTFASNVGVIVTASPFLTAVFAHYLLKGERLKARFFIGFAVAMTGVFLIGLNGNVILKLNPAGDILAFSAALMWAFYSIIIKKISSFGYNIILVTRRTFFYGLIFMVPALFIFGFDTSFVKFKEPVNLLNMLFLGLGASAICFATWNWSVKILGAVIASAYIYLVPVITVIFAALILHEKITYIAIIGTILTLIGLFISEGRFPMIKRKSNNTL